LVRLKGARDGMLANGAVAKFLAWIADKPADFHAPTRSGK